MEKYRILGIAPYEGFKWFLSNAIKKRDDIDAEIYSADLEAAVDLIHSIDLSKYDAVISRGRTGRMVQNEIDIPFVNVEFSGYDLLRSLKLAQYIQNRKIAFVTFIDLTQKVQFLTELLESDMEIITPASPDTPKEMDDLISDLFYNQNVQLFIGDGACVERASALGAETILVTSGPESLDKAIEEAIDTIEYNRKFERKNLFYHSLLEQTDVPISLFDEDKNLIYSKLFTEKNVSEIHNVLKQHIDSVFLNQTIKFIEKTSDVYWKVHGKSVTIGNKPYALFDIKKTFSETEKNPLPYEIIDLKTARDGAMLVTSNVTMSDTWNKSKVLCESNAPTFIYGGSGTGKKTFAYATYATGEFSNAPLISIDCSVLDIKLLSMLFKDEKSPLCENSYTILFNKVNLLSSDIQNKLCRYLEITDIVSKNKIISTFSGDIWSTITNGAFSKDLYYKLAGTSIYLPPLNERQDDIPAMVRTFLSSANQHMTVQIVGVEPLAMKMLQEHKWSYGITQLNSVLKKLVLVAKQQFITVDNVKSILFQNDETDLINSSCEVIDLSKTLEEISIDVINLVLSEEKGNQSKTAKRLGISRSTLWKKLNQ